MNHPSSPMNHPSSRPVGPALRVAVLGTGSWGTTLADRIARAGHRVRLWGRDASVIECLRSERRNPRYVRALRLHEGVEPDADLQACVRSAQLVFVVVTSQAFRSVSHALGDLLRPDQPVIHATKGIEERTLCRMSEILHEETCARQIGVLGGPTIAAEIVHDKPAAAVVCSHFPHVIELGRRALQAGQLRVFASHDVVGAEYAGAFKNVIGIGAGVTSELGLGHNAQAFLITRGLREMTQLAVHLGAERETFGGLLGVGDLSVTCESRDSRNHRLGAMLARGASLRDAQSELGMVAEGVSSSRSVRALCERHGLTLPLFDWVHRVLFEGVAPAAAVAGLLRLPTGHDVPRTLSHAAPRF